MTWSDVRREMRNLEPRTDTYYICDGDGTILETVETNLYDVALDWSVITAEKYGVDPESLSVLTEEEYADEYGEGA